MKINVLDHGYVRLIEAWGKGEAGCDEEIDDYEVGIIEAARQSTQGSFRGWDIDKRLLKYLYANKHSTPFEFAGMVIEVRAPIMVFREWHRHRTQSYNEMSGRYAPLPDLWYVPTIDRIMINHAVTNKQEGTIAGAKPINEENARQFRKDLEHHCQEFSIKYKQALVNGVPKEIARCGMPVAWYSQMRASTCLRNWLAFLTLRLDPAAQYEIRMFARAVGSIIEENFPRTWDLFNR